MCFRPAAASTPKTCPECGMINPAIAEKCVKCNAPLPEDRIRCPHCGEMNMIGATECSECGTSLVGADKGVSEFTAPGAPKAPGAFQPPKAPSTPKSPRGAGE